MSSSARVPLRRRQSHTFCNRKIEEFIVKICKKIWKLYENMKFELPVPLSHCFSATKKTVRVVCACVSIKRELQRRDRRSRWRWDGRRAWFRTPASSSPAIDSGTPESWLPYYHRQRPISPPREGKVLPSQIQNFAMFTPRHLPHHALIKIYFLEQFSNSKPNSNLYLNLKKNSLS